MNTDCISYNLLIFLFVTFLVNLYIVSMAQAIIFNHITASRAHCFYKSKNNKRNAPKEQKKIDNKNQ